MTIDEQRRRFPSCAALLPLAAVAGRPADSGSAPVPPIRRVGGPHLKPAVNAYSFLELLNANAKDPSRGLDLFGVCDVRARHGSDAVDLTGYFFPGYPDAPDGRYVIGSGVMPSIAGSPSVARASASTSPRPTRASASRACKRPGYDSLVEVPRLPTELQ